MTGLIFGFSPSWSPVYGKVKVMEAQEAVKEAFQWIQVTCFVFNVPSKDDKHAIIVEQNFNGNLTLIKARVGSISKVGME